MPTARNDTYSVGSGFGVYAGVAGPPAWLASTPVNAVATASNTSGAGGAPIQFFCGTAWRPDTKELYIGWAGGHGDSADNRVVSINLGADNPGSAGWVVRKAATPIGQVNLRQAYNADGTRNSTHTYTWGNRWIPEQGRLMAFGNFAMYDYVDNANFVDGFVPVGSNSGTQDPAGTFSNTSLGWYGNAKRGSNGGTGDVYAIWGSAGVKKWTAATATWSDVSVTNLQPDPIWLPWAHSTPGDFIFGLSIGYGGGGSGVRAVKFNPVTNRQDPIAFNPSDAWTAFQAAAEPYACMDFNPVDGKFYWFAGTTIYVITPNAGLTWDMATYTPTSGSLLAPVQIGGDPVAVGKFNWAWFGDVGGFLWLQGHTGNIQFLRMV